MGNQARTGAFGERIRDTPDLRFAEDVSRGLAQGRAVPAEDVARAGAAFVDRLWADPRGEGRVREGLEILLDKSPDPTARAGLVGELIAAGPRAERLLDRLTRSQGREALREFLDPAEIDALHELSRRSPAERLARVAAMLGDESTNDGHRHPVPPRDGPDREPAALPERKVAVAARREVAAGGPDPDGDSDGDANDGREAVANPAARLGDMSQPEEARVREALRLGKAAIRSLADLARDPAHREVAEAALVALGRDPELAHDVRESAIRMEQDPDTRVLGEFIRRTVEGTLMDDPAGRHLSRRAGVGEGWLNRALSNCDPPSILMAGAGREEMVIPMAFRRLAEMRLRRVARASTPSSGGAAAGV